MSVKRAYADARVDRARCVLEGTGVDATIDGSRLQVRAMRGRAVTEISLTPTAHQSHERQLLADLAAETVGDSVVE